MQLLFDESEEGPGRGLGVIPGRVRRLRAARIPQMGWNDVEGEGDALFEGVAPRVVYYANSFVCEPRDGSVVAAWSEYDGDRFAAAVRQGSLTGVQFHPEKSSLAGRRILRNFLEDAGKRMRFASWRNDAETRTAFASQSEAAETRTVFASRDPSPSESEP